MNAFHRAASRHVPALSCYRTEWCRIAHESLPNRIPTNPIRLCGWITTSHIMGASLAFVTLGDQSAKMQCVLNQPHNLLNTKTSTELSRELRIGTCLSVEGLLQPSSSTISRLELNVCKVEILSQPLHSHESHPMAHRLHSYRTGEYVNMLQQRHQMIDTMRRILQSKEFIEIETPILVNEHSSQEQKQRTGAAPFFLNSGSQMYTLPQSPQIFKQLLMCSGVERYFQVAKCFRNEKGRLDRQLEFTQLDIECAFVSNLHPIQQIIAECVIAAFDGRSRSLGDPTTWPTLNYEKCIQRYGTDKPDLRIPWELQTVRETEEQVIRMFEIPLSFEQMPSRKQLKEIEEKCNQEDSSMRIFIGKQEQFKSIVNLPKSMLSCIPTDHVVSPHSLLVLGIGNNFQQLSIRLGKCRTLLAEDYHSFPNEMAPLWVTNFPLFQLQSDEIVPNEKLSLPYQSEWNLLESVHHPFTSPFPEDIGLLHSSETTLEDLLRLRGQSVDLVVNGCEVGGGSVRIHCASLQKLLFEKYMSTRMSDCPLDVQTLMTALESGAPPHAGFALGIDRLVALATGDCVPLRDVIAFPKSALGKDIWFQN